jgi:hypothetical protein
VQDAYPGVLGGVDEDAVEQEPARSVQRVDAGAGPDRDLRALAVWMGERCAADGRRPGVDHLVQQAQRESWSTPARISPWVDRDGSP